MSEGKLSRKEIEMRVKQVIKKATGIEEEKIIVTSKLREDLGLDSFAAIEMAYNAEDEFRVSIADNELATLNTVDDIIKLIEEKLK